MNIKKYIKENSKLIYPLWHKVRLKINDLKEKRKIDAYKKYGKESLEIVMDMIIKKDYPCVAIHGTLLGLARDNHLIPWDDDIDFAFINIDKDIWDEFSKDMARIGFKKCREMEDDGIITAITYSRKGVLCDFDNYEVKDNPSRILYYANQIEGIEYKDGEYNDYKASYKEIPSIDKLIIKNFDGVNVKVPENYEDVLASIYGENWRTPNRGYNTNYKRNLEGKIIRRKVTSY